MQPQRRTAVRLLFAGALTASAACTEQTAPTAIPVAANAEVTAAAAPNANTRFKIKSFQLSSNTLRLDGPPVTVSVTLGNSGQDVQSGMLLRAEIIQGQATRQAASLATHCFPGAPPGFLPKGDCQMTFGAAASNAVGGPGMLVPGAATFTLRLIQVSGGVETEVANKSILVNLVATPSIAALSIAPTTLTIEGPAATYSVTLQNPAKSLQGVQLQGWIVQGSTRRAAGSALVTCTASAGVLPTGNCSMSSLASASNNGVLTPAFVPGVATFELQVLQNNGGVLTPLDTETVAITLTKPIISLFTLASPTVEINGPLGDYTVTIANDGVPLSDVLLQGELVQIQPAGGGATTEVTVGAGGAFVRCGGPSGYLPSGTCTMQLGISASTSAGGNGPIQPGPATFVLHLYKAPPNAAPFEWDRWKVTVELTSPTPTLTSVVPASTTLIINPPAGFTTTYVATIDNPGVSRFIVTLQARITQGATVRAAGGANVSCAGDITLGKLPPGPCVETRPISSFNQNGGTGTLVPGPATLEVSLIWFDGTSTKTLDTKSVDITLVAGATITDLTLEATEFVPGSEPNYTASFNNPFPVTLPNIRIEGHLDQGTIQNFAAGDTTVVCPGAGGALPPGPCTMSFQLRTRNADGTMPAWQLGPATFRLQLKQGNLVLDEKSVAIRFTGLQ